MTAKEIHALGGEQVAEISAEIDAILAPQRPRLRAPSPPTPMAQAAPTASIDSDPLLAALGWEPTSLDALQSRLGWRTEALSTRLLELEFEGLVRTLPGSRFERCGSA